MFSRISPTFGGGGRDSDAQRHSPSTGSATMQIASCPSQDLALTNAVFVNPVDFINLSPPSGSRGGNAIIDIAGFLFTARAHEGIPAGSVGLNMVQRKILRVSLGDVAMAGAYKGGPLRDIVLLTVELDHVTRKRGLDGVKLTAELIKRFEGQPFSVNQKVTFEWCGTNYLLSVTAVLVQGDESSSTRGMLAKDTAFVFEMAPGASIQVANQKGGMASQLFKQRDINFNKLGIGGLDSEFGDIFRRAFASRVFPPHIVERLGINHVKGMLLHGPPGTGKTLIARQLGKLLNGKEPKVVNGPEVLSKYVGQAEENIRKLFEEAEADQKKLGAASQLHIIIFDEIDALCKQRGSVRDGTGVHDTIVNQLLTKIDGVDSLNNILLIGMTNRKDLLDEALLRPGRLEVQVEIGLPDEAGRRQILAIHTSRMAANQYMDRNVDLDSLAATTKNFSGAEIEGLVKSATSYALNRQIDVNDLSKAIDEENVKVTMNDFENAMHEIKPAFGSAATSLEMYRLNGMLDRGSRFAHVLSTCRTLVAQLQRSTNTPLLSLLLEGPTGSGKTALAATLAIESGFPFVKVVSAENMVGMSEQSKCAAIAKVFDDAVKSSLSLVFLDDIERLLEYTAIGPRFSNLVLQTILILVRKLPPKGRKLLVIGTTSLPEVMESMEVSTSFNVVQHVPLLNEEDIRQVLRSLDVFHPMDLEMASASLDSELPIKKLLMLIEMALHREEELAEDGSTSKPSPSSTPGKRRISVATFAECLRDLLR
eukprot:jgi/Chlat1/148/Chrsp1S00225